MRERIMEELELVKLYFPNIEVVEHQGIIWVREPRYKLPAGWNVSESPVALNFPVGYPGAAPYGIYFPTELSFNGQQFGGACQFKPPFEGDWSMVSWAPDDGSWKPGIDVVSGTNMLSFLRSFIDRFNQGI